MQMPQWRRAAVALNSRSFALQRCNRALPREAVEVKEAGLSLRKPGLLFLKGKPMFSKWASSGASTKRVPYVQPEGILFNVAGAQAVSGGVFVGVGSAPYAVADTRCAANRQSPNAKRPGFANKAGPFG
jgi:hypothetical protein